MAGLSIGGADIGYDKAGMDGVIQAIQVDLIDQAIEKAESGVETTTQNMGDFWIGASADAFKMKMAVDTAKFKASMNSIRAGLEQELYQMMYNANNSDQTIAEDIKSQISIFN